MSATITNITQARTRARLDTEEGYDALVAHPTAYHTASATLAAVVARHKITAECAEGNEVLAYRLTYLQASLRRQVNELTHMIKMLGVVDHDV